MTQLTIKKIKIEPEWPFDLKVLQLLNIPPNYACARIFVSKDTSVLDAIHIQDYPDETKKCFIDKVRERMTFLNDEIRIDDDEF